MKGSLLQPSSTHKRKKVDENDQSKIFELLLLLSGLILLVCFYPICQAILLDNLFNFIELDGS